MANDETMYESDEENSLAFSQLNTPLTQNPSKSPLDMYATSGKLVKIVLTNFMCHRHIEVTFHENVNVILGRNGSGKSAIMAAIMVGLGGKATTTSRSTSLQQFIRTGSSSAEIKLTLSNGGRDSYQPEQYGRHVVVVRKIPKDGSPSYKIMSADGQMKSNKKEELIKILDRFNIQVDNPVSLLNQETSRNFLHSTNPATLYQLLMKATQLDSILRDYEHTEEQEAIMSDTISKKKENLKELEVEVKKLEELWNSSQGLQTLSQKLNKCTIELKWAYVKEIEQEAEVQEAKIVKEQERITKNETKLRESEEEARQMEAREEEICRDLEKVNEEAQTIESRQEAAQAALRARQKEKQKIQHDINGIKQEIKSKENERTALEQKIEETKQINFADHHAEHEQLLRQLEEAKQQRVNLLHKIDECRRALQNHRDSVTEYGQEHRHIMEQNDGLMGSIRECRNSISKLRSGSSHNLDIFGRWMTSLVNAIKSNARRFQKEPMGPLGSMITIKDQKWTIPIQKCITMGNLYAFVVDNSDDAVVLRQIMKEVIQRERTSMKFMPFIIQYHYTPHFYSCSPRIPNCPYLSVLSQLNINNATCMNVIIDHCKVDSTILVEDNDAAENYMLQPPSTVTSCYTLKGDQHLPGGRFYSNKDDPRRTRIFLATSKEHHIKIQQDQLTSLEQEQRELQGKMDQAKTAVETAKSEQRNTQTHLCRLQQDEFRVKQRVDELTTSCEEAQELKEEDIATYEEEVRECNDTINELKGQMEGHQESLDNTSQLVAEAHQEVEAARSDADTLAQRLESIERQRSEAQQQTRKVQVSRGKFQQHINKIKDTLKSYETALEDINNKLSDAMSQAESDNNERIDTDRSTQDIISEIRQIEKTIKEQEKQLGNAETIARDLNAALGRYNTLNTELEVSSQLLEKLKLTMHMRVSLVTRWRESVSTRITGQFHTLMSQRGVKGSMKVDHKKGELTLMVKFHEEQSSLATKNTKSLSGGERSFSTVALIMSLWEVTDSPFRILDEFDVFMDMMNRRISMTMMLELARKQPHKQFIFLSPQDMSTVIKGGDYMKIIKMDDPDRSQTTLD